MTSSIAFRDAGEGRPLLLIHGGGEDADLLDGQAAAFTAHGFRVGWYDRRGTGASTRDGWPDGGVDQHVADAAALLTEYALTPATVLGFSSGGVIALALAVRHPELVTRAIAWEPPVLMALPDGAAMHAAIMEPVEAHLAAQPGDWRGAQVVALSVLAGGEVDPQDPAVARQLRNAEASVRDDARVITRHAFTPGALRGAAATIAVGGGVDPLLEQVAERLADEIGTAPVVVPEAADHEVYLTDPEVLAQALAPLALGP